MLNSLENGLKIGVAHLYSSWKSIYYLTGKVGHLLTVIVIQHTRRAKI